MSDYTPIKRCTKCGKEYPKTSEFWRSYGWNGVNLRNQCKKCECVANRDWQKANPDKMRVNRKRWQKSNPDKVRESRRRWRKANPDKMRDSLRRWQKANPDKVRMFSQNRRALKAKAGGTWTAHDMSKIFICQHGRCWYCLADISAGYHIDHRIPLSRGGTNDLGNLVLACASCNLSKCNKMPDEWIGRLL